MINRHLFCILTVMAILLITSCHADFTEDTGTAVISVTQGNVKSANVALDSALDYQYQVVLHGGGETSESGWVSFDNTQDLAITNLRQGTWDFYVRACNDGVTYYSGSASMSVVPESSSNVEILMKETSNKGDGTLNVVVNGISSDSLSVKITVGSQSCYVNSSSNTCQFNIEQGYYTVTAACFSSDVLVGGEVVSAYVEPFGTTTVNISVKTNTYNGGENIKTTPTKNLNKGESVTLVLKSEDGEAHECKWTVNGEYAGTSNQFFTYTGNTLGTVYVVCSCNGKSYTCKVSTTKTVTVEFYQLRWEHVAGYACTGYKNSSGDEISFPYSAKIDFDGDITYKKLGLTPCVTATTDVEKLRSSTYIEFWLNTTDFSNLNPLNHGYKVTESPKIAVCHGDIPQLGMAYWQNLEKCYVYDCDHAYNYAWGYCSALTDIYIAQGISGIGESIVYKCPNFGTLHLTTTTDVKFSNTRTWDYNATNPENVKLVVGETW